MTTDDAQAETIIKTLLETTDALIDDQGCNRLLVLAGLVEVIQEVIRRKPAFAGVQIDSVIEILQRSRNGIKDADLN